MVWRRLLLKMFSSLYVQDGCSIQFSAFYLALDILVASMKQLDEKAMNNADGLPLAFQLATCTH